MCVCMCMCMCRAEEVFAKPVSSWYAACVRKYLRLIKMYLFDTFQTYYIKQVVNITTEIVEIVLHPF